MSSNDAESQNFDALVEWIEEQFRVLGNKQTESFAQIDQLHRQIVGLAEEVSESERKVRSVDPALQQLRGVPDKLESIEEDNEQVRQRIESGRAETDNAIRVLTAEVEYERQELADIIRKLNQVSDRLGLVAADVSQSQTQVSQLSQAMQTITERQREVEGMVEHFGLRLDRHLEVTRDMEERLRQEWRSYEDERIQIVLERLQLVGEMVKRNEEKIDEFAEEQTMRETVVQEISVWRDQHFRIDARIASVEEAAERFGGEIDRLHGQIALVEGRHSGLGERVAGMRREIAEVVDHVREEFNKYNQMIEKQRRKQIQVLEQELRETRFHALRPPEEP